LIKLIKIAVMVAGAILCLVNPSFAQQDCPTPTHVYLGGGSAIPCTAQRVSIPLYMNNPCQVGGFEIHIAPADPSWLTFAVNDPGVVDTIGSRIGNWELFMGTVQPNNQSEIILFGISNLPGGHSVSLPPGDGLICTIHPDVSIYTLSNTSLPINITFANVSDTTGYFLFQTILTPGSLNLLPSPCDINPRGDANCNGVLNGIDVIYLVNFLKGIGPTFCGHCSGDANSSGGTNGIDITYMVNYLKGIGPQPAPCN
jgi:hypothetical protein